MSDEFARDAHGRILRDRYGRPVRRRGQSGEGVSRRVERPSDEIRRRAAERRAGEVPGRQGRGGEPGRFAPRPGEQSGGAQRPGGRHAGDQRASERAWERQPGGYRGRGGAVPSRRGVDEGPSSASRGGRAQVGPDPRPGQQPDERRWEQPRPAPRHNQQPSPQAGGRRPAASGYGPTPEQPRTPRPQQPPRHVAPPTTGTSSTRMYPTAGADNSPTNTPGGQPGRRATNPTHGTGTGAGAGYRQPTPHYNSAGGATRHPAQPGEYLPGYEDAPINPAYRTPASYERSHVPPAYHQPAPNYQARPQPIDPNVGRAPSSARRAPGGGWLRKLLRPRGCLRSLALLVVLAFVGIIGLGLWADSSISRVAYQPPVRVAGGGGTNWLLVGSDSRQGLTEEDVQRLGTGGDIGSSRTDTIMVLHVPLAGKPTLLSIPRDSYVQVPGYGMEKINASFAEGGAPLLVQTVEQSTGLHIDHYAEIGFGGFAAMVDAVGGLELCPKEDIDDPLAQLNVVAGCQQMDGPTALGFVRTRATAMGDLDRVERQREFFTALVHKMTSAGTLANPWRDVQLTRALVNTLTIGEGDHVWSLLRVAIAAAGGVETLTVPVGGFQDTEVGNVVVWDEPAATNLFHELGAKN